MVSEVPSSGSCLVEVETYERTREIQALVEEGLDS
jgi:hypothetical protein